ncbi:MAG TPA: discoidin domain-containing protein [Puia sp.]|nr:discoidin domain-containing protein [Puia sp.]
MKQQALILGAALLFCTISANAQVDVLTQHNDINRTGWNSQETQLNTRNVKTGSFGKLFTLTLDDKVYAQPLIVSGVNMSVGVRNVVYVATVNNTVYAFDADSVRTTGAFWQVSLTPSGTRPPRNTDMAPPLCGGAYNDFQGNMGIIGTPVIDKTAGTLYIVARGVTTNGTNTYSQYLHALDIKTGAEKAGSPVAITAQVNGTGDGNVGGVITFDPKKQNQRPGLLLLNGIVYIGYASHCDWDAYHGWLLGYDATTLQQKIVYNTTPGGGQGGIWMSGAGPAADELGNIYLSTGNGTVGTTNNPSDLTNRGEGVVKLTPSGSTLTVSSFFTPFNYTALDAADLDFGSANLILIPNTQIAACGSKEGRIYMLNRNNMGGVSTSTNNVLQYIDLGSSAHMRTALGYYKGSTNEFIYSWPENSLLKAFPMDRVGGKLNVAGTVSSGVQGPIGNSGAMISTSSNGAVDSTGSIWASHSNNCDANQTTCPGILRAISANDVTKELWNSNMVSGDNVGNYAKFVCPTIANGKVYLPSGSSRLLVYGLTGGSADTCNGSNVALNTTATASSVRSGANPASAAVDGKTTTSWASNSANGEWIYTDLTKKYDLCRVVLRWQTTAGIDYNIDVSDDAGSWNTIATIRGANPGTLTSTINVHGSGRYVRMQGITPGTVGGFYALLEMEVYGAPTVTCAPPGGFTATGQSDGSELLNWPAVANASGYSIQYRNVSVSDWTTISSSTNSIVLPALSCGYDYLYQVASTCGTGQQSAYSAPTGFSTPTCPADCPPLPTRWSSADIGTVGMAGSACYLSQFLVYLLKGSGSDIGGTADAFRFAYVSVVGDDQIVARIASQDATDPNNKAGIMFRENNSVGARNAFIGITHSQGAVFQYRSATGGSTTVYTATGANIKAPYWVKLVKSNNSYAGYISSNGMSWTQVGPVINLGFGATAAVSGGYAITSHNNTMASSANSDNFSQSTPAPLPVKLTSFTAKPVDDQYVSFEWTTAMEQNTDHFEVERCVDGVFFKTVLTVKAVGNSNTPQHYSGEDMKARATINYYRLKMVDLDGNFDYSPIVMVRLGEKAVEPLVFPNPVDGVFNISAGRETMKEINVYDISGRRRARVLNPSASNLVAIPCATWAQGLYIVEIRTATDRYIKKIIKR